MSESKVIANIFDYTRSLTKHYIEELKNINVYKYYEVNGVKLNSVLWIIAHLAWAEKYIMLESIGGPEVKIDWLKEFRIGAEANPKDSWPKYEEALKAMDEVHATAKEFVKGMDDKLLEDEIYLKDVDWRTTKRTILYHAIRHEGTHAGHLSWICKINGIKTF